MALASSYGGGSLSGALECDITQVDDSILIYGNDGTTNRAIKTDSTGAVQVDVESITGDVTVVQGTATNLKTQAEQYVGGTAVSNANPVPVSDAGSSLTVDGTIAATQSGTWNITDVSGTVSLPTGAATESTLSALNTKIGASSLFVDNLVVNGTTDGTASTGAIATFLLGYDLISDTFQPLTTNTDGGAGSVLNVNIVPNESIPVDSVTSGDIAHDAVDSGNPVKIGGKAVDPTSLPTAVAANDRSNCYTSLQGEQLVYLSRLIWGEDETNTLMATATKPVAVSTYSPDMDTSTATEASSVSKASAGVLYDVTFSNGNANTRYFQLFNSTTVPADTTIPVVTFACPPSSTIALSWPKGRYFSTGIVWCNSTTQNSKTIGSADSLADVHYK